MPAPRRPRSWARMAWRWIRAATSMSAKCRGPSGRNSSRTYRGRTTSARCRNTRKCTNGLQMSELAEAIARLEQAVGRLEAATDPAGRAARDREIAEVAAALAGRIDAAVARL